LQEIREAIGLPISEALKHGLRVFRERVASEAVRRPYDVYKSLDLGAGGWATDSSDEVRRSVSRALKKKFKR